MSDEIIQEEEAQQVTEPHGEEAEQKPEIDWKAEARKWEKRAKESNARLQSIDADNERYAEAVKRAEEAERLAADLKRQKELGDVALEYGIPASLINGANVEEMRASAEAIKAYTDTLPIHPVVQGTGEPSKPTVSKEAILAITDEKERLKAIRDNAELFKH